MTGEQFQQLVKNRRCRYAREAFDPVLVAWTLRQAATNDHQQERAQAGLEAVLPEDWLRASRVEAVEHGVLVVSVADPLIQERMRRQARQLEKRLSHNLPGLRRLMVVGR